MASLQATTETAGTGLTRDLRTTKLAHFEKNSQAKQNRRLFSELFAVAPWSCRAIG